MSTRLRFAFFGSCFGGVSSHRATSYCRAIAHALAGRGHRITFAEDDESTVLATLERAASSADVLVMTHAGPSDATLAAALPQVARSTTSTVLWDLEATASLERMRQNPGDPLRPLVPKYDLVFTYGGGDRVVRGYEAFGARSCTPIHDAVDPHAHFPVPGDDRFRTTLGLLANRLASRDARVEELFLHPARKLPQKTFLLGGSGWEDATLPSNVRALGRLAHDDHNAFHCSALAVLSVAREGMASAGTSPGGRVFEAAGAGACLITDAWEGVGAFFEPGREVLVAEDGDHVASILSSLSEDRARIIGQNARRRVLADHTYDMRALQAESLLLVRTRARRRSPAGLWA